MAIERLQKVMAASGVASRRACEVLIANGRVTVDGKPAKLGPKGRVTVKSLPVRLEFR